MKKLIYQVFLITTVVILFASCSKKGDTGPTGPTGQMGPAGTNGSVIYSGTTAPASTVGAVGDFYINLTAGQLYGPKTATSWGSGILLIGAAGVAGSRIYNGSTNPTNDIGVVGDYYLNSSDYMFYGPKTSSGWRTPINLQGATGPQGPQGPTGNANVVTTVFTITNSQWLYPSYYYFQNSPTTSAYYTTRYYSNAVSSITQDVLDNGFVLVYFAPNPGRNANQWEPLPYQYSNPAGSGNFNYEFAYETSVGQVTFHFFFVGTGTSGAPDLSTYTIPDYKFKVISVTGRISSALLKSHINLADYKVVSRFTGVWQQDLN